MSVFYTLLELLGFFELFLNQCISIYFQNGGNDEWQVANRKKGNYV